MKAMKKISGKHVRYRGTSTLEAAFVLPILILMTLAIMGFGWLFLRVHPSLAFVIYVQAITHERFVLEAGAARERDRFTPPPY